MWVVGKRFSEEAELKLRLARGERPCRGTVGGRSIPAGRKELEGSRSKTGTGTAAGGEKGIITPRPPGCWGTK